jgi:hypothetical protein
MMRASTRNPTRQDRAVVTKPPISGPDRSRNRAGRAHERVELRPHLPFEVAVDQRLHSGQVERSAPSPPMTAQKTMIAQTLCATTIASAPAA